MTNYDKKAFAEIMTVMAENFGVGISAANMQMRFQMLAEYPIEQVREAAMDIMKTRKYTSMPTIAEFIESLGGGRLEDIALVEATKVWAAVEDHGSYSSVVFDDAVTQAVIQLCYGGWVRMCQEMLVDQQKWFLKDFAKHYESYSRQKQAFYGKLPGQLALDRGEERKAYIGDKQKALAIEDKGKDQLEIEAMSFCLKNSENE